HGQHDETASSEGTEMNKTKTNRLAALFTAGMVVAGIAGASLTSSALAQGRNESKTQPAGDAKDRLILRDGRILEGKILKEDDKQIEFQLIMAGGLTATRMV